MPSTCHGCAAATPSSLHDGYSWQVDESDYDGQLSAARTASQDALRQETAAKEAAQRLQADAEASLAVAQEKAQARLAVSSLHPCCFRTSRLTSRGAAG